MKIEEKRPLIILTALSILISGIIPAFGEVTLLQSDYATYGKGDKIKFSGTFVEDSTGLITIVIRDPNDEFVMLTQALMNPDNTFEKIVDTNSKFSLVGTYNATAFIYNMTEGITVDFGYGISKTSHTTETTKSTEIQDNEVIVSEPQGSLSTENSASVKETTENTNEITKPSFVDPTKDPQYYIDRYNNEPAYQEWFDRNYPDITIEEAVGYEPPKLADFVDPTKDPQYYIDRYNNEPAYQEWFDRNYPDITIEEAVGYENNTVVEESIMPDYIESKTVEEKISDENIGEVITTEILPDAEASTIVEPINSTLNDNSELTQMVLAIAGLMVLFGAVYGIKRKVDNNSEQISQNKATIKKKLLGNILHNDPLEIIQQRLANGEINVDEYKKLKNALKRC